MIVNLLEAYGIPCIRQYPNDGDFGRLILGTSGTGVEIYVPKTMYEDAVNLSEGAQNMTRNYKEEYQRWLDSPALSESEWEELNSIANDEKEIESRFLRRSSSALPDCAEQ